MKCLSTNKLPSAKGRIIHDWHAEVLALRAFNRLLLDHCLLMSTPPYTASDILRQRTPDEYTDSEQQPFTIREDVSLHMYCSEAPCGDASMELVMDAQEDATPWTSAPPLVAGSANGQTSSSVEGEEVFALRGRANFSLLGAVRCKPSRQDAPPTLSKSCTDKLALKQATSLLSSTAAMLISPRNAYLESLILPSSQLIPSACERAFSRVGRLKDLPIDTSNQWTGGYRFQGFEVKPTTREFAFSRRKVLAGEKAVASNLSAVYTPTLEETLIGGVLQGRKQSDPRGASKVCRRNTWALALQVATIASLPIIEKLSAKTYKDLKEGASSRTQVKKDVRAALKGWARNSGDEDFGIEDVQISS
jgi:tRNA-specific adenosine deaminase 1